MAEDLTAETLRSILRYDPDTGHFYSRQPSRQDPGKPVGFRRLNGYWFTRVRDRQYRLHRLAWLYVYGVWPTHQIDHINGDPSDNRIANLRDVPPIVNSQNKSRPQRNSTTGYLGVSKSRSGGYRASVQIKGRSFYLGTFDTAEQAHARYLEEAGALRGRAQSA